MARATSFSQQRQLTLTEELEKLEQSITLTLQEIDHNFSRAHRIVTSSILPIVEQYGQHSRQVWEGSKFWKQFFESSANVSLSGYEEQPSMQEPTEETIGEDSNATTHTTLETSQYETPSAQHISTDSIQDIDLSNLTISPSHSTPRPAKQKDPTDSEFENTATFADYPSPYEALRQEVVNNSNEATNLSHAPGYAPETPAKSSAVLNDSHDIAMTPQSSPFLPLPPTSNSRPSAARQKTDPLLHRVLDRNYRVQATPMAGNRYKTGLPTQKPLATPGTAVRNDLLDSTLSSSPEMAAPVLHTELFNSPEHRKPRTPGVSVLTPGKADAGAAGGAKHTKIWDSDDDFDDDNDDDFGQSPPKTMQFHVPQSRLLKTPAKEASKRIVQDLLLTAGMSRGNNDYDDEFTDEIDTRGMMMNMDDENSPSMVRKVEAYEDESF